MAFGDDLLNERQVQLLRDLARLQEYGYIEDGETESQVGTGDYDHGMVEAAPVVTSRGITLLRSRYPDTTDRSE